MHQISQFLLTHIRAMEVNNSFNRSLPSPLSAIRAMIPRTCRWSLTSLMPSLFIAVLISSVGSVPLVNSPGSPYSRFCNDFVTESTPTATKPDGYPNLRLYAAYFAGGESILGLRNSSVKSASFQIEDVYKTESDGILNVYATMSFWGSDSVRFWGKFGRRGLRQINYRRPRLPSRRRNSAAFRLQGFWSELSGKLCMVGTGMSNLQSVDVVLKLNYPTVSVLDTSVVRGTLSGINVSAQFDPVSILGFSMVNYQYKYVDAEVEKETFTVYDNMDSAALGKTYPGICMAFRSFHRFELQYLESCANVVCNPLGGVNRNLPKFMSLNEIDCGGGKVRYLLDFSDVNFNGRRLPFDPNTILVAEGAWNAEKHHLDLVACRMLNVTGPAMSASIGDCSIRLSLRFPATLSLRNRSTVVGLMWSSKKVDDLGYFGKIAFQSLTNGNTRLEGLKYEYTAVDNVNGSCLKKRTDKHRGAKYANGLSSDMRFDMVVRDGKGQRAWGYASPLSVGDQFYLHRPFFASVNQSQFQVNSTQSGILNISYIINFTPQGKFELGGDDSSSKFVEISAEGTYDPATGVLCMLGCRHIKSLGKRFSNNETFDCEILINIQYHALKSTVRSDVEGTIRSNRTKSDPLYFDQLELSATSIFNVQARDSIWRMDLEITIVLISNTFLCIFVILQLIYGKKHQDVLPFISLMMLTVLTLAQMIPLVLNFEALFMSNRNRQNVFLGSGGWLEVNEVLVRVITMIAFLLEFRLLQQAWSSRFGDGNLKSLWASDKKVVYLSMPLYIGGALIAWLAHEWKYTHKTMELHLHRFGYKKQQSLWTDFKSYAGLVLDGFLLPQILFNVFCNTREKALAPPFYVGITVVRLLPHAYDLYRAGGSSWYESGIYAKKGMDYYSTMWDISISCGGLVLIVLVYLQQRFGGRCFLPKRFRESTVYEKVPSLI